MEKNEVYNKIFVALSHHGTGELTIEELKSFIDVVVNHNPYGKESNYNIEYGKLNYSNSGNSVTYAKYSSGKIVVDEGFMDDIIKGKASIGDLLITLFHEQTHGEQDEIAAEIKTNPEKFKHLDSTRKMAAEAVNNRILDMVFPSTIDNYYVMFKEYFPEDFTEGYAEKREMIMHAIYLTRLYEIDARHQSCVKTYDFLKRLHEDFKDNETICAWCEREKVAIDKTVEVEKQNIKLVNKMEDLVSFKVSNEYLQKLEEIYFKAKNAEQVIAHMNKTNTATNKESLDKQGALHRFYMDLQEGLDMFIETQPLSDLVDYYTFLISNKRDLAIKDIDTEKKEGTLTYNDEFARLFEKAIEDKLKYASEEEKAECSKKLVEAANRENHYLCDWSGTDCEIFKFLTPEDKKELVRKQMTRPASFFAAIPRDFADLFDVNNAEDIEYAEGMLRLYRENYGKPPANDSPFERCKQREINTLLFFNGMHLKSLFVKFGKEDEYNEIMERETERVKFDDEVVKKAEIAVFGRTLKESEKAEKKIDLMDTHYIKFV